MSREDGLTRRESFVPLIVMLSGASLALPPNTYAQTSSGYSPYLSTADGSAQAFTRAVGSADFNGLCEIVSDDFRLLQAGDDKPSAKGNQICALMYHFSPITLELGGKKLERALSKASAETMEYPYSDEDRARLKIPFVDIDYYLQPDSAVAIVEFSYQFKVDGMFVGEERKGAGISLRKEKESWRPKGLVGWTIITNVG